MIPTVGTHLIATERGRKMGKGKITALRKFHEHGELHIVIEWEGIGPVQYTEAMLYECLHEGKIKIDKQHYRNEKFDQLGI